MIDRNTNILKNKSFFLFGARGTGKSTLIRTWIAEGRDLYLNFLDPELTEEFRLKPNRFKQLALGQEPDAVIFVDEVQKVPKVLDIVHDLIETTNLKFVLTGSSARRLKQSGTNLLAGRALVYNLWPFSSKELKTIFSLDKALHAGLLPESYLSEVSQEADEYLKAYCFTYIEKEIQQEQWVRKIEPFQKFLPIAAQMNGEIINKSKIASEVGVDDMTVHNYFEILEDTLMGFHLPAYNKSVRKQQRSGAKFYWVDLGIVRALTKSLDVPIKPHTYAYGKSFEHFIVLEIKKALELSRKQWSLFYARTRDGVEIDLILERPGLKTVQMEIKSKDEVSEADCKGLKGFGVDLDKDAMRILISNDKREQIFSETKAMHWQSAIDSIFG